MKKVIQQSFSKTLNNIKESLPVLLAVFLLVSLFQNLVSSELIARAFRGNYLDPIIGAFFGSIASGTPITSYVIGGELLDQGVGLVAIAAFIIAWVTVGVLQYPAEALLLGNKFAIVRNIVAFISAVVIAYLIFTVINYGS